MKDPGASVSASADGDNDAFLTDPRLLSSKATLSYTEVRHCYWTIPPWGLGKVLAPFWCPTWHSEGVCVLPGNSLRIRGPGLQKRSGLTLRLLASQTRNSSKTQGWS